MKKPLITLLIIALLATISLALNIDLKVIPAKSEFYDNESVLLNISATNYELSLAAKDAKIMVEREGENITIPIDDLEPGSKVSRTLELGKFDAGTYRLKTYLEYDFLGIKERTQAQYQNIMVIPSVPIRMKTYSMIITDIRIPEDLVVNQEFEIEFDVNSSTDSGFVEFSIAGEESKEEDLREGMQTISEDYKIEYGGTYVFEVRAYTNEGEFRSLRDYRTKRFTVIDPSRYEHVEFTPIEKKKGNITIEIGKEPRKNLIKEVGCFVIGGCKGDLTGPQIKDIEDETSANKTVFTITADDTETGNSKITGCEINVNYDGWKTMSPVDGNFDSSVEEASYTLESLIGEQAVMFRCTDEFGNTGYSSASKVQGKVDVVIVTMGYKVKKSKKLLSAVNMYLKAIKRDNLVGKYVELDSEGTEEMFNVRVRDTESWEETKDILDKIIYKLEPRYVLILGGLNIFPMPPAQTNSKIPFIPNSDDRYADTDLDGIPDIIIGRIPLRNPDDIADYLMSVSSLHGSTLDTKKLVIGDACGGPPDCFLRKDVDYTSNFVFGSNCEQAKDCLLSPPYCTGRGVLPIFPIPCANKNDMIDAINSAGFIIIDAHGDGRLLAAVDENIVTGSKVLTGRQIHSDLDFANKILMTPACFGGSIDDSILGLLPTEEGMIRIPLTQSSSIAMASVDKNAAVFIGNTRFGYGTITVKLLGDIYKGTQSGKTIGEAFIDMKKSRLESSHSDWGNAVIYEVQLYGDPTLNVR